MLKSITKFFLDRDAKGHVAIFAEQIKGHRCWVCDPLTISYIGSEEMVNLMNAGLAKMREEG